MKTGTVVSWEDCIGPRILKDETPSRDLLRYPSEGAWKQTSDTEEGLTCFSNKNIKVVWKVGLSREMEEWSFSSIENNYIFSAAIWNSCSKAILLPSINCWPCVVRIPVRTLFSRMLQENVELAPEPLPIFTECLIGLYWIYSMMRYVEACISSEGPHFDYLIWFGLGYWTAYGY